jgi:predicted extracellular nuclease
MSNSSDNAQPSSSSAMEGSIDPIINEFVFNHAGADTREYVEILGAPNTDYSNFSILQVEGNKFSSPGYVFSFFRVGTTNENGVWTTKFLSDWLDGTATLLLVENFTGRRGTEITDLDANNDGVIDFTPFDRVVDGISISDGDLGDLTYARTVLQITPEGSQAPRGGASRIPNGADTDSVADWVWNDFDLAGIPGIEGNPSNGEALNTPGAINVIVKPIYEIQGAGHSSPFVGYAVNTQGIVTAIANDGFYLQDPTGDGDEATSDGIFVFTGAAPTVQVGNLLAVTGQVSEFFPGGEESGNLSITQLIDPKMTVLSSDNALPAPVSLGADGRTPPTDIIDNDNFETFDPSQDGADFYESLEGMRVQVQDAIAISPNNRFGEIFTLPKGGTGATGLSERGTINISPDDFNPERIQIQIDSDLLPSFAPEVNVGDRLGNVTGVVSYSFGNFEVLATEKFPLISGELQPETTDLIGTADQLTIATYNVLNLDPKVEESSLTEGQAGEVDDDLGEGRFAAIANQIVNNLKAPDIIALQEVQDSDGAEQTEVTDATLTYQTLIEAIVEAGGPRYEFRDIAPIDDKSGGQPGGNIRVGYLLNPTRVEFVEGSLDRIEDPDLSDGNAFSDSRNPLIAKFRFNGQEVSVINNHFSSKGGSTSVFGTTQPPVNGGVNQREAQAQIVNDYVDSLLVTDAAANVVVLGDLNEFEFLSPLNILKGGTSPVLTNLTETLPDNERYSYIFEGNSQALDHILVSNNLAERAEFDAVHVNSEFFDQASDHDPLITRLNLPPLPDPVIAPTPEDLGEPDGISELDDGDGLIPGVVIQPSTTNLEGTEAGVVPVDSSLSQGVAEGAGAIATPITNTLQSSLNVTPGSSNFTNPDTSLL